MQDLASISSRNSEASGEPRFCLSWSPIRVLARVLGALASSQLGTSCFIYSLALASAPVTFL